ncbi:zinc metallopeptidase [Clostridium sp. Marseille-P299]|uniref:zinc metallopeptidase n=1 Tax=Clostridium sp. Marseille-P299 TaxID=1805477 RepID=UPI0008351716|nr:zinc metallopeptidase [Clostridium sp. Marseille-P299]
MLLYYGYPFMFDPTYMLVILGAVICLIASAKMRSTYAKYQRVRSLSGLTGAQAAERVLRNAGIYDVSIQRVSGNLTDHYDPRTKTLRLSDSVYNDSSVAAIGVAAHECGHAIQHNLGYAPLKLRGALVPVANIGANLAWPMIIIGVIIGWVQPLITLGIVLFSLAVLFQLVTLPVEFDASRRAVRVLGDTGILYGDEISHTKKVLTAAALTYVAGAASSILQLLRLILLFGNRNRDN